MQVPKDQNGAVDFFRKRVHTGDLQIQLPDGNSNIMFRSNPSGLSQAIGRPITADHLRASLRHTDPVMALAAREIQHRPRQATAEEVDETNKKGGSFQFRSHCSTMVSRKKEARR